MRSIVVTSMIANSSLVVEPRPSVTRVEHGERPLKRGDDAMKDNRNRPAQPSLTWPASHANGVANDHGPEVQVAPPQRRGAQSRGDPPPGSGRLAANPP